MLPAQHGAHGYRAVCDNPDVTADIPICSAKGCRKPAVWSLRWNNPKIHPPERRKTWLACEDHRAYLTGFLAARDFLRETEPVST
jgi:hypothetical protein